MLKSLGHRVTAFGLATDPEKVETLLKLPMLTNVSLLSSLLRGLSYYRNIIPGINYGGESMTHHRTAEKKARFAFEVKKMRIVQSPLKWLSSPEMLAFPDFALAISGERSCSLTTH